MTNINELLSKRVSLLVVINEEGVDGGNAHVTAVIFSQPVVIPHEVILGHLGEAIPFWLWRIDNHWLKMRDAGIAPEPPPPG